MTFSTLASPGVSLQGGGGSGGGGGTPGGSDTQIQYNSSGTFAGASGLTTNGTNLTLGSASQLLWSTDTILTRRGAANLRFGAGDAAAPVAQTLSVQSVVAGTSNTAGTNLTITGSQGTGTGAGGSIIFQVAPAGSSGTAQNALSTALTINADLSLTAIGPIIGSGNSGRFTFSAISSGFAYGGVNNANGIAFFSLNGGLNTNLTIHSVGTFGFSSTTSAFSTPDVILQRDTSNTLAQRNGVNAQAFRLYNTFTSATNFERSNIFWDTNVLKIGTEKGSAGGTARALEFQTDGTTRLTIAATTGNVTTTGSVTTEAPTGGTAAAWRLGTVASVTPTLPNRTIEVDIGGTIYYLSAKTTND